MPKPNVVIIIFIGDWYDNLILHEKFLSLWIGAKELCDAWEFITEKVAIQNVIYKLIWL